MSSYLGIDPTVLQARLTEAQAAYHKLSTGQKAVTVTHDGRSVQYDRTSIANLRAYIEELQRALGLAVPKRRPMRPYFGHC